MNRVVPLTHFFGVKICYNWTSSVDLYVFFFRNITVITAIKPYFRCSGDALIRQNGPFTPGVSGVKIGFDVISGLAEVVNCLQALLLRYTNIKYFTKLVLTQ